MAFSYLRIVSCKERLVLCSSWFSAAIFWASSAALIAPSYKPCFYWVKYKTSNSSSLVLISRSSLFRNSSSKSYFSILICISRFEFSSKRVKKRGWSSIITCGEREPFVDDILEELLPFFFPLVPLLVDTVVKVREKLLLIDFSDISICLDFFFSAISRSLFAYSSYYRSKVWTRSAKSKKSPNISQKSVPLTFVCFLFKSESM